LPTNFFALSNNWNRLDRHLQELALSEPGRPAFDALVRQMSAGESPQI
jgi:hypothetical protein